MADPPTEVQALSVGRLARTSTYPFASGPTVPSALRTLRNPKLDIPLADDDDEQVPAGDLGIIADLGVSAMDLGALCDDVDLYPEEMLEEIAEALGFGTQFHEAIEAIG